MTNQTVQRNNHNIVYKFIFGTTDNSPDFEKLITVILTTFAVFTGYTINDYLKRSLGDINSLWAFLAVASLLLRYIFGSAIHLNSTYIGPSKLNAATGETTREPAHSQSVLLLFKDFAFLLLFGILAIHMTDVDPTKQPDSFGHRLMWFVGAGFAWSISDYYIRRCWAPFTSSIGKTDDWLLRLVDFAGFVILAWLSWRAYQAPDAAALIPAFALTIAAAFVFCAVNYWISAKVDQIPQEWPGPFWRVWTCLDGLQFLVTWIVLQWSPSNLLLILAILYLVFLFADLLAMVRAVQLQLK